ncbi:FRG domain-containing protein [Klebsiella aerogenes]
MAHYIELANTIIDRRKDICNAYKIFKSQLPGYISEVNSKEYLINSDISILLLAQYYGLPTRFIDLTLNPLISLYFAVCGSSPDTTTPAAVYIYDNESDG